MVQTTLTTKGLVFKATMRWLQGALTLHVALVLKIHLKTDLPIMT